MLWLADKGCTLLCVSICLTPLCWLFVSLFSYYGVCVSENENIQMAGLSAPHWSGACSTGTRLAHFLARFGGRWVHYEAQVPSTGTSHIPNTHPLPSSKPTVGPEKSPIYKKYTDTWECS